jgi:hypothetical protein
MIGSNLSLSPGESDSSLLHKRRFGSRRLGWEVEGVAIEVDVAPSPALGGGGDFRL